MAQATVHIHPLLFISSATHSSLDDFYVFESSRVLTAPRRVALADLPNLNLLKQLLVPAENYVLPGKPLVELKSEKSGISLQFDTNRKLSCFPYTILFANLISAESGAMFYTNGLSSASKGSKKKIHGGSGIENHGDGYDPGSTFFFSDLVIQCTGAHTSFLGAAFLEFHDILQAFLDPKNKNTDDDTLLTQEELYHNYVRCDVWYREP